MPGKADMERRRDGRIVVVTGGTAGVGRATARAFAERVSAVAVLARGPAGLEATRREIEQRGARALAIPTDVADAEQVEAAAARIEHELGPIDVWVNNAMTTIFGPIWDVEPKEYARATEVTYLGGVYGTMAALRRMRARDGGVIVNVGSALAYRSIPLQAPYCGAKHALRGFTDSVRCELIHEGSSVRITMTHLPGLNTPQFSWCRSKFDRHPQPVPPIYNPEVAADAIVWASEHDRREVFVGAPTFKTIWGAKLAPSLLDHYLADTAWGGQLMESGEGRGAVGDGGTATADRSGASGAVEREPRRDNLFEPVPGDFGAHGIFDARARDESPVTEIEKARPWVLGGLALVLAGTAVGLLASGD